MVGIMRFPSQICTRWIDRPEVDWRLASFNLGFWGGKTSSFNIIHLNDTPILHNIIWNGSLLGETSGRRWSSPREAFDSEWTPLQIWKYTKKPPTTAARNRDHQGLWVHSLQNGWPCVRPPQNGLPNEKIIQPANQPIRLLATGSDDGLGRLRKSSESLGEIRWDDWRMRWLEDEMMRWLDDEMIRGWDDEMMRWLEDEMMRWLEDEIMRWLEDEMMG